MPHLSRDPNGNPFFVYTGVDGIILATPHNTDVYNYSPEYRGCDHIYTSLRDLGEYTTGSFLFRIAVGEAFDDIVVEMVDNGFEDFYQDVPDDKDMEVFDLFIDQLVPKVKNKDIKKWLGDR